MTLRLLPIQSMHREYLEEALNYKPPNRERSYMLYCVEKDGTITVIRK